MIYVRLRTLLLCLAIFGRMILPASLILCFGTMPIVQVANAQSPVAIFNCPSGFALSGSCGVGGDISGGSGPFGVNGTTDGSTPALVGSKVDLVPGGCGHCAISLNYQSAVVNVQAFQSTFTFIPNGWNISFVLNNTNNQSNFNGAHFSAGAGCEGGFFQGFSEPAPPNNLFALMLDQYGTLMAGGNPVGTQDFTYSSVQYYQGAFASNAPNPPGQSPCNPNLGSNISGFTYAGISKNIHVSGPAEFSRQQRQYDNGRHLFSQHYIRWKQSVD